MTPFFRSLSLGILAIVALVVTAVTPAAAQSYVAQPGDTLQVEVVEDSTLNRSIIVLPGGQASFPFAGTFQAAGRSLGQIGNTIANALAPNYASTPTVFVSVAGTAPEAAESMISVYVLGEVTAPGEKEVREGTSILQFLAKSGGFTNFAATSRLQLRRTDPATGAETIYKIDYDALERGATFRGGSTLIDGDVILVPERGLFE